MKRSGFSDEQIDNISNEVGLVKNVFSPSLLFLSTPLFLRGCARWLGCFRDCDRSRSPN